MPKKRLQGVVKKTPPHKRKAPSSTHGSLFIFIGIVFVGIGLTILALTYGNILLLELGFTVHHDVFKEKQTVITPIDMEFGIVIPKIGANAKVIPNVDPYDSRLYQNALSKGVAQAKGSGYPGMNRNIFLFAHSSVNFYDALRYNSIFYLIHKLETGDEIVLYYHNIRYSYHVMDKRIVPPSMVNYMFTVPKVETVTLMTCWPPGTTNSRMIVIAERSL